MRVFISLALIVPARSASSQLLRREWPEMAVDDGRTLFPDELDDLTWDGIDVPNPPRLRWDATGWHPPGENMPKNAAETNGRVPMQILGLFNTGTNLMQWLMEGNFKDVVFNDHKVWKHSAISRLAKDQISKGFRHENVVTIAMVRNPISWLQSMRQKPYDLRDCLENGDWLNNPCDLPQGCGEVRAFYADHTCQYEPAENATRFKNVEEYWNSNVRDYSQLGDFGFPKSVVVQYEKLVLDTENVMKHIADTLGLPNVPKMKNITEIGQSHGRDAAVKKLTAKSYLDLYNGDEKGKACSNLDRGLMQHFEYSDC